MSKIQRLSKTVLESLAQLKKSYHIHIIDSTINGLHKKWAP